MPPTRWRPPMPSERPGPVARRAGEIRALVAALCLLLLSAAPSGAAELSSPAVVLPQGGIALLLFPPSSSVKEIAVGPTRARVHLWRHQSSQSSKAKEDSFRAVLVGVDFSTPPKTLPLTLLGPGGHENLSLAVTPRPFQVSRLSVARSFVTPPRLLSQTSGPGAEGHPRGSCGARLPFSLSPGLCGATFGKGDP